MDYMKMHEEQLKREKAVEKLGTVVNDDELWGTKLDFMVENYNDEYLGGFLHR